MRAKNLAQRHANMCNTMASWAESHGFPRSRLIFEGLNEPHYWSDEPPAAVAEYYKWLTVFNHGFNTRTMEFNSGVGWPGNGGVQNAPPEWAWAKPTIDVMTAGDYLGSHEYWALNGPTENWKWWAGRFLQCPYQVPMVITECGIDTGVTGNWFGG